MGLLGNYVRVLESLYSLPRSVKLAQNTLINLAHKLASFDHPQKAKWLPQESTSRQQEHDFGSSKWRYKSPEATSGFLGATWLLEAACMPPETAQVSGKKITPSPKTCVPRADRAVNRNVTDFVSEGMESAQTTYDFMGLCDPGRLTFF